MKKAVLLSVILLGAMALRAQPTTDEIALIQAAYGMEKRAIVEQYMKITDAEKDAFWKVYEEYELSRKAYGQNRVKILVDYANNYMTMTDAQATTFVKDALANQMTFNKLQQTTFTKLAKVMSAKRAAQFTQLENYLESVIRINIVDDVPFIGELDDIRKN